MYLIIGGLRTSVGTRPIIGRYSTECRSIYWPMYGMIVHLMILMVSVNISTAILSVVYRSTIVYKSVDCRSSLGRHLTISIGWHLSDRSIGQYVTRPTLDVVLTDSQSIIDQCMGWYICWYNIGRGPQQDTWSVKRMGHHACFHATMLTNMVLYTWRLLIFLRNK